MNYQYRPSFDGVQNSLLGLLGDELFSILQPFSPQVKILPAYRYSPCHVHRVESSPFPLYSIYATKVPVSFFPRIVTLCRTPRRMHPDHYNLNQFKPRVNRYHCNMHPLSPSVHLYNNFIH